MISFIYRHFLIFRRNNHVACKLPENYLNKIQEFLSYNIKLRNKNSYELDEMGNMDDISIYSESKHSAIV